MFATVNNKKGMSPLIALIVLVSIAVSLGVLAINLINLLTSSDVSSPVCGLVDFNIKKFNDIPFLCVTDSNKLAFVIENTGKQEITHFKISIIGSSKSYSTELEANLEPGDLLDKRNSPLPYGLIGILYEVKILPEVKLNEDGKPIPCTEKAKSFVKIPKCSEIDKLGRI
ncbi:MAG: hypothetical protein PWP03_543 [Candidatus Woesearchaeota archaeon]|nr:hypothetical protein [Candidatus Woesearchaeota archaeon]